MLGNVIVWKPADTQVYSEAIMELFVAGLPDGVINMITVDMVQQPEILFLNIQIFQLHFTGSTGVFRNLWKEKVQYRKVQNLPKNCR